MLTQRQAALQGKITDQMAEVARQEGVTPEFIRDGVAKGTICIPANINHKNLVPRGWAKAFPPKSTPISVLLPLSRIPLRNWTN